MKIKSGKGKASKGKNCFHSPNYHFSFETKTNVAEMLHVKLHEATREKGRGLVSIVGLFCSECMKNVFNIERACYSNGTLQTSAQAIGIIKASANVNPTHERVVISLAAV